MEDLDLPTSHITVNEVTALVNLFNSQLALMEGRLVAKMDDNSRLASERWVKHDHDAEKILSDIDHRFTKMEAAFDKRTCTIEKALEVHIAEAKERWDKEHDEDLILDARLTPVKGAIAYFRRNWKTILLVIVSVLAVLGFSVNTFEQIVGHVGR